MTYPLWELLGKLRSDCKWVELSHSLTNETPVWSGIPDGSVELCPTAYDWGNPMLECLIQTFKFPGQFGTHADFPGHFIKEAPLSESFGPEYMAFPLCVIDVSEKARADVHYAATADDIRAYEAQYGPIPEGALVALRTDWSRFWPDGDKMSGLAEDGSEHFPGWSLEALRYIYEERAAAANGHETFDTDASAEAVKAGDLACERYVLALGKIQFELMCHLDEVPPAGAIVFAAWPRIEGATGLPARLVAICPKKGVRTEI